MARVIVILALMFLISAVIFGLTRKPTGAARGLDADARATVPLGEATETPAPGKSDAATTAIAATEQKTGAATAQEVMSGSVAGASPAFSTVGVDHRGRASFTGTASPGDEVSVTRDGKPLGTGRADKTGNWTVEFKVPAVREEFALAVVAKRASAEPVTGPQKALVSPPASAGGLPRITLMASEPKPDEGAEAAKVEPDVGIVIERAVPDGKGSATINGKADAGATIQLQVNNKLVVSTKVASDGTWGLTVKNETAVNVSAVRIVLLNADGKQMDSADLNLSLVATKVAAPEPAKPSASAEAVPTTPGNASAPKVSGRYVKIRRGDSLWRLAKRHYGDGRKWKRILRANRHSIGNPDLIYHGRRLYLPG
ncbi:MAG: Ig-like domain-containing protein [Micropepsaceae bacterium]